MVGRMLSLDTVELVTVGRGLNELRTSKKKRNLANIKYLIISVVN